jgi:hypothetical protein
MFTVIPSQDAYIIPTTTLRLLDNFIVMTAFTHGLDQQFPPCTYPPGSRLPLQARCKESMPGLTDFPVVLQTRADNSSLRIGLSVSDQASLRNKLISYYFPFSWAQMTEALRSVAYSTIMEIGWMGEGSGWVGRWCQMAFSRQFRTQLNGCSALSLNGVSTPELELIGPGVGVGSCSTTICARELQLTLWQAINVATIKAASKYL